MSDPTPTLNDSLSTMLTSAKAAVKANKLDDACNWVGQAVQATNSSQDLETRAQVTSAATAVLMKAAVDTRRSVLRGAGLFAGLDSNVQVIGRCATQLADMARGADRGIALAQALVIGGFAKELIAAIEPHKGSLYAVTDASGLDAFLTTLGEVIRAASRLTTDPSPQGNTDAERAKLAATAVSNARHSLSRVFSKKLSDWDKARILCRHAQALVDTSHPSLKDSFEAAQRALAANNYQISDGVLKALEADLGGGE